LVKNDVKGLRRTLKRVSGFLLGTVFGLFGARGVPAQPSGSPVDLPTAAPAFHLEASVSRLSGDTRYVLRALAENPAEPGTLVEIRSELEFPLDTTLLGATLRWRPGAKADGSWDLGAGLRFNFVDPSEKMIDQDWVGSRQFAYTESDAQLDLLLANADVRYRFRDGSRLTLAAVLLFEYQRIEQHLIGFEGWQGSLFSDQRFPVSGTGPVIDYRVTYVSPQLGLNARYWSGHRSWLGGQVSVGVVHASDTDDHLRRGRIAEGQGWGVGVGSRLEAGFWPARWLSLRGGGGLRYFYAEGQVTQRWYRDGDLPEGFVIPDIPYELESLQFDIGLDLGVAL
jgi:hypothetical protein